MVRDAEPRPERLHGDPGDVHPGLSAHWNVMLSASVKLLVTVGLASRYQAWKFQVSPGSAVVKPVGVGIERTD